MVYIPELFREGIILGIFSATFLGVQFISKMVPMGQAFHIPIMIQCMNNRHCICVCLTKVDYVLKCITITIYFVTIGMFSDAVQAQALTQSQVCICF